MKPPAGIPAVWNGKPFRYAWAYRDRAGAVKGHVARFDDATDKECIPFFGRNGKAEGPPAPCPLFGLDSLKNPQAPVYIVEGEKIAAALHALGLQAVTSIGGALAAGKADWTPLQGFRRVIALPDNDEPGETYARDVVAALGRLPGSRDVKVCRLPGLPEAGDVVDFLQGRVPAWDGFEPIPREPGDDLQAELLAEIEAAAVPAPAEWTQPAPPIAAETEPWAAPVPLDAAAIPEWPGNVFPPDVQRFVDALAASTETPPELSAMMTLAVLATAAQGKFRVRVATDYFEPLSLWTCCALQSGSRKTAVWQAATAPLVEWEAARRGEFEPMIKRAESERKTLQSRADGLRAKAAKCKVDDVQSLMQEIEALENEMPEVPRLPQVWAADITAESLPVVMSENSECVALLSDEGGIFDTLAGRYSNGVPNLDVYLQGHAGSPVRVNRGSRPSIFLRRPALSIGLTPQNDVVRALADKPGFRGRGLLARFLYAMPQSNLGRRTLRAAPMPDYVQESYAATIHAMLDLPWAQDATGRPRAHVLAIAPDALGLLQQFAHKVEARLADGGTFAHITDWGGKLPGAAVRMAAVFHVARYAHGEPWETPIGADHMAAALCLADVLGKHALIAFDCMGADAAFDDGRVILSWVAREGLQEFTRRDCHAAHKHRFARAEGLQAPLDVLIERGYIRPRSRAVVKAVGRPSQVFEVNPLWLVKPC